LPLGYRLSPYVQPVEARWGCDGVKESRIGGVAHRKQIFKDGTACCKAKPIRRHSIGQDDFPYATSNCSGQDRCIDGEVQSTFTCNIDAASEYSSR